MDKQQPEKKDSTRKRSILGSLFSRPERDKEYIPDLQTQWAKMDTSERVKFVAGGVAGLILFIGSLLIVLFILTRMIS